MWKNVFAALLLASLSSGTWALDCDALSEKAHQKGDRISDQTSDFYAVGKGNVAFYSAPDVRCKRHDHVLKPGQHVIAYSQYGKYTFVLFQIPAGEDEVSAWVLTSRLWATGTGVGPTDQPSR